MNAAKAEGLSLQRAGSWQGGGTRGGMGICRELPLAASSAQQGQGTARVHLQIRSAPGWPQLGAAHLLGPHISESGKKRREHQEGALVRQRRWTVSRYSFKLK